MNSVLMETTIADVIAALGQLGIDDGASFRAMRWGHVQVRGQLLVVRHPVTGAVHDAPLDSTTGRAIVAWFTWAADRMQVDVPDPDAPAFAAAPGQPKPMPTRWLSELARQRVSIAEWDQLLDEHSAVLHASGCAAAIRRLRQATSDFGKATFGGAVGRSDRPSAPSTTPAVVTARSSGADAGADGRRFEHADDPHEDEDEGEDAVAAEDPGHQDDGHQDDQVEDRAAALRTLQERRAARAAARRWTTPVRRPRGRTEAVPVQVRPVLRNLARLAGVRPGTAKVYGSALRCIFERLGGELPESEEALVRAVEQVAYSTAYTDAASAWRALCRAVQAAGEDLVDLVDLPPSPTSS